MGTVYPHAPGGISVCMSAGESEGRLSFERDIKPLFRERDRGAMLSVAKFDLWSYEDVSQRSEDILGRLEDGSMPCDQAWPEDQVGRFRDWVQNGMAE
jgi:hypothetical protein